jgi:hypothetical protein
MNNFFEDLAIKIKTLFLLALDDKHLHISYLLQAKYIHTVSQLLFIFHIVPSNYTGMATPPLSQFPTFLHRQLLITPRIPSETTFTGQVVIFTGSNIDFGLEAARHITRLGAAKVILAVRSAEKKEVAKTSVEESTGRQRVVQVWNLDL